MESLTESCGRRRSVSTYHHIFILLEDVQVPVLQGIIASLNCTDWVLHNWWNYDVQSNLGQTWCSDLNPERNSLISSSSCLLKSKCRALQPSNDSFNQVAFRTTKTAISRLQIYQSSSCIQLFNLIYKELKSFLILPFFLKPPRTHWFSPN